MIFRDARCAGRLALAGRAGGEYRRPDRIADTDARTFHAIAERAGVLTIERHAWRDVLRAAVEVAHVRRDFRTSTYATGGSWFALHGAILHG